MNTSNLSTRQAKKGYSSTPDRLKASAPSIADSSTTYASYRKDPTREKILLCVADYPIPKSWMTCIAKFDTGCDDDWMSEELASEIGIALEEVELLICQNFDKSEFLSSRAALNVTWMHDEDGKSICGTFRIVKHPPFEMVIGKRTLFKEGILAKGAKIKVHHAGVLVARKPTDEEKKRLREEDKKRKEKSDALLKKQAQREKEKEEAALAAKRGFPKG